MKKKALLFLIVFVFVLGSFIPAVSMDMMINVEESLEDHQIAFSVDFSLEQLEIEALHIGDREYLQIRLMDYEVNAEPGKPMLPVILQSVGIPLGASYSLEVTGENPQEIALSAPLLPKPTQVFDENSLLEATPSELPLYTLEYLQDADVYEGYEVIPNELGMISNDGIMRTQRILTIALNPIQYHPAEQKITVFARLNVVLQLEPGYETFQSGQLPQESEVFEGLFSSKLQNYEQAKNWRFDAIKSDDVQLSPGASSLIGRWTPPQNSWRIQVLEDGIYQLDYDKLVSAGVPLTGTDPRKMQMWYRGQEMAIQVEGEADGVFDSEDKIIFAAQAEESNKYSQYNAYWLTIADENGKRMAVRDVTPGDAEYISDYPMTLKIEDNKSYLSRYQGTDDLERYVGDPFTGEVAKDTGAITVGRWARNFELLDVSDGSGSLDVVIVGFSSHSALSPQHHSTFWINGIYVGDLSFDGQFTMGQVSLEVPAGVFNDGTNLIEIKIPMDNQIDPDDFSVLKRDAQIFDKIVITARSNFRASSSSYQFTAEAYGERQVTFTGLIDDDIIGFDITDPHNCVVLQNFSVDDDSDMEISFKDNFNGEHEYWFGEDSVFKQVSSITQDTHSDLLSTTNQADWIIISHPDFMTQAQNLANWRQTHGLNAMAVDLQDVYDEFAYGNNNAYAVKEFLAYAFESWEKPAPSYVVLMGDGHYDPKNITRSNRVSFFPPLLLNHDPFWVENSMDNAYVHLAGDDLLPEMMIGRLPANTEAEAAAMVTKIINYESDGSNNTWKRVVTDLADKTGTAGNFPAMSYMLIHDELPAAYHDVNTSIYYQITHPDIESTRAAVLNAFNEGNLIFNYIGHSSTIQYGSPIYFRTDNLPLLTNNERPSINIIMSCMEGYYIDPRRPGTTNYVDSLGEQFVRYANGGAVASWSSAGMSVASGHDQMNRGFFRAVFTDQVVTLGEAIHKGLFRLWQYGNFQDLLYTYHLFGDPALRIQRTLLARPDRFAIETNETLNFSLDDLTINDDNPPGLPLTFDFEAPPLYGILEDLGNGNWRYVPPEDFAGMDIFEYSLFDGTVRSNSTKVFIYVRSFELFFPLVLLQ